MNDFTFIFLSVLLIGGSFFMGFMKGYRQVPDLTPESTDPNGLKEILKGSISNGLKEGKAWVIRTVVLSFVVVSAIAIIKSWLVS